MQGLLPSFYIVWNLCRQCIVDEANSSFSGLWLIFRQRKHHHFRAKSNRDLILCLSFLDFFRCENAWRCDHLGLWNHLAARHHRSNFVSLPLQGLSKGPVKYKTSISSFPIWNISISFRRPLWTIKPLSLHIFNSLLQNLNSTYMRMGWNI